MFCSKRLLIKSVIKSINRLKSQGIVLGSSANEVVAKWKQKFANENISEIDSSIKHILDHVIGRNERKLDQNILLTEMQLNRFEQLCECRIARMPVQYILGEWDFCNITLKVIPPVFIPRMETEELCELILQQCDDKLTMRFLDIGSGTGAISLSLLHSLPKAQCIAIDQSEYACKLTLENATSLSLQNRIKIIKHKLESDSELLEIEGKLDLIVSNPPYIPTEDIKTLPDEISLYEDLRALDGGIDGLDMIQSILLFASRRLCLQGHLWLEVYSKSHPVLIQQYLNDHKASLNLQFIACYKDMFNKDRFVEIKKI